MLSMTSYSKVTYEDKDFRVSIELKSVNGKNLFLKIRSSSLLNFLENEIRKKIASKITRGSVELKIDFFDKRERKDIIEFDNNISNAYMEIFDMLEKKYSKKFSNQLDILVKQQNVIRKKEIEVDEKCYRKIIFKVLENTLEKMQHMREKEGKHTKEHISTIMLSIEKRFNFIKKNKNEVVKEYKKRLLERLNIISSDVIFKEEDVLKEILLFTDRSDISEEVSRLESHLKEFKLTLEENDKPIGKKLDFILQEIRRELNTLGVKSNMYAIAKEVVECKSDVERMREDIMNIE